MCGFFNHFPYAIFVRFFEGVRYLNFRKVLKLYFQANQIFVFLNNVSFYSFVVLFFVFISAWIVGISVLFLFFSSHFLCLGFFFPRSYQTFFKILSKSHANFAVILLPSLLCSSLFPSLMWPLFIKR